MLLCASLSLPAIGCGAKRGTDEAEQGPSKTRDAGSQVGKAREPSEADDEPVIPECPEENPFCNEKKPAANVPAQSCGGEEINLATTGVNVMIAVDGSASMVPHWTRVQDAVKKLRKENPASSFGVHMFYGNPPESLDAVFGKNNLCGETENVVLDVAQRSEQELLDFVGTAPPGAANDLLPSSPLIDPINYYLTHATKLADPTRTNYLVIISDGVDNCFGSFYTNPADKRLALEKLAVELVKKNIRIIPVGFVATPDTGTDMAAQMRAAARAATRVAALDTLARFGGSGLDKALAAEKPEDLLTAIGQVGIRVGSCRFSIPATLDPSASLNPFELNFTVNGNMVARDRTNSEGWNFVDGKTSEVEIFGKACEAVRGGAKVESKKSCDTDVCGTAAVKVETKPRAVLHLLDSSASRIECETGDQYACIRGVGNGTDRPVLTFWEVVEHALSQSLIAPINDDVEFGLQFFPAKNSEAFSCEVASAPEVPPAPATQITIMSQMFERLPFGRSPVLAALQSIADAPGRLAEPTVSGAVVLLTDGGDNCTDGDAATVQAQIVAGLSASAAKLLKAGVKTYVVRFGKQANKTPEQEEQLRAIVANGGTASSDPKDMNAVPYIDAVDATALDAALAQVSDRLSSCAFTISGVPDAADKTHANLYLNGELIPFDAANAGAEGWSWANPEQTDIELHGNACTSFKTNRTTSVIVEFGCESVIVI